LIRNLGFSSKYDLTYSYLPLGADIASITKHSYNNELLKKTINVYNLVASREFLRKNSLSIH